MRRFGVLLFFAATLALRAQDTRAVAEPAIPPACITLKASLAATDNNRSVAEADEA